MSTQAVYQGNNLDLLARLPDCSVHAVVTDPPYGLSFMGRDWDKALPDPRTWSECLRVLRPGGHLVAFGAPRLYHRLACQIEDAGFEIRDCLLWLFGSGFPKSLDVSKAIDKVRDDTDDVRAVCRWLRARMNERGETSATVAERFGMHSRMVDHWAARDTDSQPNLPTLEQWDKLRALLDFGPEMDAEVYRLNKRKGNPGEAWLERDVVGTFRAPPPGGVAYPLSSRDGLRRSDTPATPEAATWSGWGTALKPAYEPIVLARKPLDGTVAANVQRWGTGAINVDGCRVPSDEVTGWGGGGSSLHEGGLSREGGEARPVTGRWPANLILSDEGDEEWRRYFYSPKASRSEREAGLEGLPPRVVDESRAEGSAGRDNPRAGAGRKGDGRRNHHPTVKPIELMRWLVRLVTPPGGIVVEPFSGSGTTPSACALEDVDCIAMEIDANYVAISRARVEHYRRIRASSSSNHPAKATA